MNFKILIISGLLVSCSTTYDYRLSKKIEKTEYEYSENEIDGSGIGMLSKVNLDIESLKGITLFQLNTERRKKNLTVFGVDSVLTQMSQSLLNDFRTSSFISSDSWGRKRRALKNILQMQGHSNKLCSAHAFTVDILDLPFGDRFHYRIADGESDIHLYEGRKPTKKEKEKKDYTEPEPLTLIDGKVFSARVLESLKNNSKYEIYSKEFTTLGVSFKLDQRSMNCRKRPRLFGIIIFGGKRTQKVKIHPKILEYEKEQSDSKKTR